MASGEGPDTSPDQLTADELRAVFNAVNDAIFVHDADGEVVDVNQTAAEMYGYSRDELREGHVGMTSSGVPPYTEETARNNLKRAAQGESFRDEWQGQTSDGRVFWEEVSLSRATVDGDVRVIAIIRDIHDRKTVEGRFQTLIDNLPGMVYRCRNETGWPMEFVGGQCEQLTGYDAAALESDRVDWGDEVIHPDDRDWVSQPVTTALAKDEPFELTYRIQTATDETRWVWERGQQIDPANSDHELLEGFITDITDRVEAKQQVEEQRDSLDVLNGVLRHDIRNDLQLITTYTELIAEECDDEQAQEYIGLVEENARHAIELTTTARQISDAMLLTDTELQSVTLKPTLEDELAEIQSAYPAATVTCETDIPAATVHADELLGSVFRNLLQNAIQHNDKEVPTVTVSATEGTDTVTVEIADNGPGIPDRQKDDVFDKGKAGLQSAGTGLGLYLVKTLVEGYDGDVWVTDNDPIGAVFAVELPTGQ